MSCSVEQLEQYGADTQLGNFSPSSHEVIYDYLKSNKGIAFLKSEIRDVLIAHGFTGNKQSMGCLISVALKKYPELKRKFMSKRLHCYYKP